MNKQQLFLLFLFSSFYCNCFAQDKTDTSINVFFKTNSFELDTSQFGTIKDFLAVCPIITHITGYADNTGTTTYNLALSKRRAYAIYNAIKANVDSLKSNIVTFYGESEELPKQWMNRRVQICGYKLPAPAQALENSKAPNTRDTISVINLDNIYFYPDKPILLQESVPYLQELAQQLKNVPAGALEIIGHVNYQSQLDSMHLRDLYLLSELRAKAVYDYLLELGIPATRMRYKGVGNSQPLFVSPKNEEEKRKNMRVQVIIMRK